MEVSLLISILMRWIHVITAITILGGSIYTRFVLMPAVATLPDAEHQALRSRLTATWKKFVMGGILLFLVSGFYNYIVVAIPQHKGDGLYHALMGIKILISLAVFFLASALVGRSAGLEPIRANARKWLTVTILLSLIVVCIAGYLKVARGGKPLTITPTAVNG